MFRAPHAPLPMRRNAHGGPWRAARGGECWTDSGKRRRRSVLPDDPDDDALNEDVPLLETHGLHAGVGRLKPDPATGLAVELLDRGFRSVDERDDHLAVLRGLL